MALSFEESKKLLAQQVSAPMMASIPTMMTVPAEAADVMTLSAGDTTGSIAAYSEWTRSNKYVWSDQYSDDKTSYIDKNKNITVDASQINITQEENSQFIPFEMPRYYDGFDLMQTTLSIHYITSDGYYGDAAPINVSYDTSTIKFGWLIDGRVTHIAGNVKFEIRAIGVNSNGDAYVWKSRTFDKMTVMQSLIDDRSIELDDSWVQELVTRIAENIGEQIANAELSDYVTEGEVQAAVDSALTNYYTKSQVDSAVSTLGNTVQSQYALKTEIPTQVSSLENDAGYLTEHQSLDNYATKTDVQNAVDAIDVTDQLKSYALIADVDSKIGTLGVDAEGNDLTVVEYVDNAVAAIDVSDQLGDLSDEEGNARTVKEYVDDSVAAVDVSGQLVDYAKSADVYTKTEIDLKTDALSSSISTNATSITSLGGTVGALQTAVNSIDKSPRLTYDIAYNDVDNPEVGENGFVLYEITNEGVEGESKTIKK